MKRQEEIKWEKSMGDFGVLVDDTILKNLLRSHRKLLSRNMVRSNLCFDHSSFHVADVKKVKKRRAQVDR